MQVSFACLAIAVTFLAAAPSLEAAEEPQDVALAALRSGQIVPLSEIIKVVESSQVGSVIEIELLRNDGLWVYEVELLQTTGSVVEIYFDASTKKAIYLK